jgi:hypothetical protein
MHELIRIFIVMPGLDLGIHALLRSWSYRVDCRAEPGNDGFSGD